MAKRKVATARRRASTAARRKTSARPAGTGAPKTGRATKAARAMKPRKATAGSRPVKGAKAAKAKTRSKPAMSKPAMSKPARPKPGRAKASRAKAAPDRKAVRPAAKAAKTAKTGRRAPVARAAAPEVAKKLVRAVVPLPPARRKRAPDLDRERRRVQDDDAVVSPTPPSSLGLDRSASSARSGRQELRERYNQHTETGPTLTAGDIDADWESAYSVGDEAPGGDNPTPDQNVVDDIGAAVGVAYDDNEELEGAQRIEERDRHRWEFDPASSDDFDER